MDSGGILCFHYSFSCGPEVSARLLHTLDVYTML